VILVRRVLLNSNDSDKTSSSSIMLFSSFPNPVCKIVLKFACMGISIFISPAQRRSGIWENSVSDARQILADEVVRRVCSSMHDKMIGDGSRRISLDVAFLDPKLQKMYRLQPQSLIPNMI